MTNNKISNRTWRVIDTGLLSGAENIAYNKAILDAHQQEKIPHTLRFLQFTPCALIGFHQSVEQELRVEYCQSHNIEIQRRITGGGAIYFDETQIGWELYLSKQFFATADMADIARRICEAAAIGISRLGVKAKFRPRNDIEVDGKKVSGTGGAFDGDSIMYQGTLLVNFDVERMLRVLRIPAEKLTGKAIDSARDRVANLKDLIGVEPKLSEVKTQLANAFAEAFSIELDYQQQVTNIEQQLFEDALQEIRQPEWVYQTNRSQSEMPILEGIYRCPGGLIRTAVSLDKIKDRIKQVWISGDFFVNPKRMVVDLEAILRDTRVEDLEKNVLRFFSDSKLGNNVEMLLLKPDDFIRAIEVALQSQNTSTVLEEC
jgi:lipoate-protein ligase A